MFTKLVFSRPTRRPSARWLVLAGLVHAAAVLTAVRATTRNSAPGIPPRPDTILLLPAPPQPGVRSTHTPPPPTPHPAARLFSDLLLRPLPPPVIPTLDLEQLAGSHMKELLAAIPKESIGNLSGEYRAAGELPMVEGDLDQRPALISGPRPSYPPGLERAGVSGRVELSFVIGVTGRADSASLRVLRADHPAFAAAATEAVLASRFTPGQHLGKPVPVLVRQVFGFQKR